MASVSDRRAADGGGDALLQRFNARIEGRAARRDQPEVSAEREAYRRAAAVLGSFELPRLRPMPFGTDAVAPNPLVLLPDVLPVSGHVNERVVTLRGPVRRATLERMGGVDAFRAALAANPPAEPTPLQDRIERWITGDLPDLSQSSYEDLTEWVQVASWFDGLVPGRPLLEELQRLLNRQSVYAKFAHLADREFTGREHELATLRDYVGVLEPGSAASAVGRQLRHWLGLTQRTPLVVEGVGGIGKSALIGKFLVEHASVPAELRFPFSYLAFDNPALHVNEPVTIVAEIARQLELLSPDYARTLRAFSEQLDGYGRERRRLDETANIAVSRLERTQRLRTIDATLFTAFSNAVQEICTGPEGHTPFVLVFDTFEEALYGGWERLLGVVEFLRLLNRLVPTLRVVVSMRPPLTVPDSIMSTTPSRLKVTALPHDASVTLLRRLGVSDPALADLVARQIGGNPLNLRLAARLVEHDQVGSGGVRGIRTRSWLIFNMSDEIVRGQLYARILAHIHNEHVRKLAHPGMVLRRVTPAMILDVLAAPCGVAVSGPEHAQALFDELAAEHTLVDRDVDGSLRYRQDIRGPALALLQQDKPAQVRHIHEGAVRFYEQHPEELESRTEELYHRLALDQEPDVIAARWNDAAAASLAPAVSELPSRAQAWLATRLGFDVAPEIRRRAALEDWERAVGRKARDLLRYMKPVQALGLLTERPERTPASPLFALESKALVLMDRLDAAADALDRGIESVEESRNRGRLAELLWLRAQIAERQHKLADADHLLERAAHVARNIHDPLCLLQITAQRMLLRKPLAVSRGSMGSAAEMRERLAAQVSALTTEQMLLDRSLVRTAITVLGPEYRSAFLAAVRVVGVGEPSLDDQREMARALRGLAVDGSTQVTLARCADDLENARVGFAHALPLLLATPPSYPVVLPALQRLLEREAYSLSAANLAGINEYREPWELESPLEAA